MELLDCDDVGRVDRSTADVERRGARRVFHVGDLPEERLVVENRVSVCIERGDGQRILAIGELVAAAIGALPRDGVETALGGAGPGPDRLAGRVLNREIDRRRRGPGLLRARRGRRRGRRGLTAEFG